MKKKLHKAGLAESSLQLNHHSTPDFRGAFRILKLNKLWIISSLCIGLSFAIYKHINEQPSFVSTSILSLNVREKTLSMADTAGMMNNNNFTPKVLSLIEQFKAPEACIALTKFVTNFTKNKFVSKSFSSENSDEFCGSLSFQPDSERLQVRVVSRIDDPVLSQAISNAASIIFIDRDQRVLRTKISEMKRFLTNQERELGRQVHNKETEKAEFQAKFSIITVGQAEKAITEKLEKSEREYLDLQVQIQNNEKMIEQTQKSLNDLKNSLNNPEATQSSLYLSQAQYRLNMLQYRKSMLSTQTDPDAMKKVNDEIEQIMKVYQRAIDGKGDAEVELGGNSIEYVKSLKNNFHNLKSNRERMLAHSSKLEENIKKKGTELKSLASNMQRLGELSRESDIANNLYMAVKKRLQEVEIEESGSVSNFSILKKATIGVPENTPLSKKLAFNGGVGLFISLVILFLINTMIPTVKDLNDLDLIGVAGVGYIPQIPISPLYNSPQLINEHPDSLEADSFRALRLRLQSLKTMKGNENKSIVILTTSPRPSTGKSFITTNLGLCFANSNFKTLIIDFDLRHPTIVRYLRDENVNGNMPEEPDKEKIINAIESCNPKLDILATNFSIENSADYIERADLAGLLQLLNNRYDFILIDAPPLLSVIDAFLISPVADAHLLIVEHRKTYKEDVTSSMELLQELKSVPILGVINKAHPEIIYADVGRYYKMLPPNGRRVS